MMCNRTMHTAVRLLKASWLEQHAAVTLDCTLSASLGVQQLLYKGNI